MPNLRSTSYAILGQLALRSWSSYALITEVRRNFHYFYPRAESGLYAELKSLERLGMISTEKEYQGRRGRSVYSITDAGRRALEAWLATPTKPTQLEFEGLARILFGDFASFQQLLATLAQVEADATELLETAAKIRAEYQSGTAPFQEQVHLRAFVFDFLWNYAQMTRAWAQRTQGEIGQWERLTPSERQQRGLKIIERSLNEEDERRCAKAHNK